MHSNFVFKDNSKVHKVDYKPNLGTSLLQNDHYRFKKPDVIPKP